MGFWWWEVPLELLGVGGCRYRANWTSEGTATREWAGQGVQWPPHTLSSQGGI